MTALATLDPRISSPLFAPEVSQLAIGDGERRIMHHLAGLLLDPNYQAELDMSALYYDCMNTVASLGISVPPELEPLRGVLGWCAAGVDARSERLTVLGFRMPGQTVTDDELQQIWQANNLDAESGLVHDDAMIYGRSFVVVGADDGTDDPLITVESPRNMIGSWDVRRRELSAALQTYRDIDPASQTYATQLATLYTRDAILQLSLQERGWQVDERHDHRMGFVPVQMFAHKPTVRNRYGASVMNPAWRNTQDRACRTLVRSEVAGEFFAMMKIILLGPSEQDFQRPDGTQASAWETFAGRLSTLQADAHGNLPQVEVVRGDSPDGFISTLNHQAQIMSGHTGLPPQYHGIFSDGNPASADAIRMSDFRLKTTADQLAVTFGNDWEDTMRMAMRVKGLDVTGAERMETDWAYTGIPTPNADAVTVSTQIQAGMIPPTADDALAACGWSPVQRQRFSAERKRYDGLQLDQLLGFKQPDTGAPAQPMDGSQPQALAALNSRRTTDANNAG